MFVFCRRTLFIENVENIRTQGKQDSKFYVAFKRGKIYNYMEPLEHTSGFIYRHILSERGEWLAIKKSEYKKHFVEIDEYRNIKIDEILK